MIPTMFTCADCGETIKYVNKSGCGGTGYATVREDGIEKKVCYRCCAKRDCAEMAATGRIVLYLTAGSMVTNWPGTLKFRVAHSRPGRHNFAGRMVSVWFTDSDGREWYGRNIGDNQILRCKRLKAA